MSLLGLDPQTYASHPVHATDRSYVETNCYADILVELLHARGHEPLAMLGHLVRMDFEGDQWTFFKPPQYDLEVLYGIDIHEMQPYRDLPAQIATQIDAGRTVIVELDAWWLPDTAATSYRREHVKTSAAIEAIDPPGERMRYFHNTSLHELSGEDYRGVFTPGPLPPYCEIVRFDAGTALDGGALREASRGLLAQHLTRRAPGDPFARFLASLQAELPRLLEGSDADYHAYAFATVRMVGSAAELLTAYAAWIGADEAVEPLQAVVDGSKVLNFRLARRRPFDPAERVEALGADWARAMTAFEAAAR